MSEIGKMYENAEVKKQIPKVCSSNELYCKECEAHIENAMPYCKNAEYPPFTAEKQLLLLQYIEKLDWIDAVVSFYYMNEEWVFLAQPITEFSNEQMRDFGGKQKEYEQALAQMINTLWQDLTEEEQQQIKEILE